MDPLLMVFLALAPSLTAIIGRIVALREQGWDQEAQEAYRRALELEGAMAA